LANFEEHFFHALGRIRVRRFKASSIGNKCSGALRKEYARMSEQARKVKNKNIPEWAQGLYYSSGLMSEVLVYHDDEAIYFEHKGKDSGIVRFTFEMIEGLKIVEEDEGGDEDSPQ
jgi:hypothetical protein